MESLLPGFLSQLKVILTKQSCIFETFFVEHSGRIIYVHLQINLTSEHTSKEKQYSEAFSQKQVLIIRRYHTDNVNSPMTPSSIQ